MKLQNIGTVFTERTGKQFPFKDYDPKNPYNATWVGAILSWYYDEILTIDETLDLFSELHRDGFNAKVFYESYIRLLLSKIGR